MADLVTTIANIAQQKGVDPLTAIATAIHESSLNTDAVGDGGTSFGLFQLHEGGELPSRMTQTQAENPATNAGIALSEFQNVQRNNPGLSPGQLAAMSQRPANQGAYANSVNDIYNSLKAITTKNHTLSYSQAASQYMHGNDQNITTTDFSGNTVIPPDPGKPGSGLSQIAQAIAGPQITSFLTNIFLPATWIRVASGIGGVVLIVMGLLFIIKDYSSNEKKEN